jgi:serine phosphatase RsbU (regulator of sigma subunit)/anti-sigma regulatory factor (Ser/Thr protein kinase)
MVGLNNKLRNFWQIFTRVSPAPEEEMPAPQANGDLAAAQHITLDQSDPLVAFFRKAHGVVEIDKLEIDSPILRSLKESGVALAVPLISQGELIGVLNLGKRLSEQEYSADDYSLLNNLATQAAPSLRVAQLVREQEQEARARERIENEMRVARLIQKTLLPKELPELGGWSLDVYYQPARAVGGDFYDFIHLKDGRLGLIIGDVTDKGVPAAIVMATTRSVMRSTAEQLSEPGEVLERANNLLCPDIPENMFVTCLYAILDPLTGRLEFANAGHDLPYRSFAGGVGELRARGMPLGLMPGMKYEQKEVVIQPGDSVLFYSDGLVEAHNPHGEMFGFPRLKELVSQHKGDAGLIEFLLGELEGFTSTGWEQEDDVTFLTLHRAEGCVDNDTESSGSDTGERWKTLGEFSILSEPGNERLAMEKVSAVLEPIHIQDREMERMKTAVAEATMNAIEHGNHFKVDHPVNIKVCINEQKIAVRIRDDGAGQEIPEPELPNLEAKLRGEQTPRGWGLFLIKSMVDEMNISVDDKHHTLELVFYREGGKP